MKFERFNESLRIKVLLGVITILLIVFMFPKGEAIIGEVPIGTIWVQDDLIAPFSFPIYKDPKIYSEAKKIEKTTWPEFRKIIGDKWSPGANLPFDPKAAKEAGRLGLKVMFVKGVDLRRVSIALDGGDLLGSIIE